MKARAFVSRVLNVKNIAPDIRKICLSFPSDFSFDAGQYISIKIPSQNPIRRSYSIFSKPSDKDSIEICFKRIRYFLTCYFNRKNSRKLRCNNNSVFVYQKHCRGLNRGRHMSRFSPFVTIPISQNFR